MSTYTGHPPYTDEYSERVDNSEHLQVGAFGAKQVVLYDASGNAVTLGANSSTTGTVTSVAGNASNVTLLASNTSRKGAVIFNDSSAILYVKFGATATTSSFTYRVNPYQTLEIKGEMLYTGRIDGIWASATGNARVTELT